MNLTVSEFNALVDQYAEKAQALYPEHKGHAYQFSRSILSGIGKIWICPRCGGEGILRGFRHVYNGICFKCNGAAVTAGMTVLDLATKLSSEPQLFEKKLAAKVKGLQRKHEKDAEKFRQLQAKRQAARDEALKVLSDEDRMDFLNIATAVKLAHEDFSKRYNELSDTEFKAHPYTKFPEIVKDILEKFELYGNLSEKQLLVVLKIMRENAARAEALKSAPTYRAGEFIENVTATVTKIEEVSYQVTSWISGVTQKVILTGTHGEKFVLKTNAARLLDTLRASLENKAPVKFSAEVKWVAPDGYPVVLTPRGFRFK